MADAPQNLSQEMMNQQAQQQAAAQAQNNLPITLSLTLGEVNTALQVLNTGQFNVVLPIINKIIGQSQEQITAQQTGQNQGLQGVIPQLSNSNFQG